MGNSEQKEQHIAEENFEHPRLGHVKLIANNPHKPEEGCRIEYLVPVNNEKEVQNWIKNKKTIENAETTQVLLLPVKHIFEKEGMCGSSGIVKLYFEDYLFLLESEIINRREITKPFLEAEIWYLVFNILKAGKEYERFNKKIGDIQPRNIVVNQDGQIKLIACESWPNSLTNYELLVENREAKVYVAPQQFVDASIKKGQYPSNVNASSAQVFSIGLTLLESATLEQMQNLYIRTPFLTFNHDKLKNILANFQNKYSVFLVNVISSLVEVNPHLRPLCSQIYSVLMPYEEDILNLQQFIVNFSRSEEAYQTFIRTNAKKSQWSLHSLFGSKQTKQVIPPYQSYMQTPQNINMPNLSQTYGNQKQVIQPQFNNPVIRTNNSGNYPPGVSQQMRYTNVNNMNQFR